MDKLKQTAAGTALGASSYTSPDVKVTEILSEGVLCMSIIGKLSFSQNEEWEEVDNFEW